LEQREIGERRFWRSLSFRDGPQKPLRFDQIKLRFIDASPGQADPDGAPAVSAVTTINEANLRIARPTSLTVSPVDMILTASMTSSSSASIKVRSAPAHFLA
jgi:hypothetical protein